MSARSKVRVHELGLPSSHIGAQRTERKVVRWKFSPIADKHAGKMHYRHSHGCKIHSRAWSSADRGTPREKWRWRRGRKKGGAGGGGYCRAHEAALMPVLILRHRPCSWGVYGKGRGSAAPSQAGNRRRERSIKAIGTSGQKHRKRKKRGRRSVGWCLREREA